MRQFEDYRFANKTLSVETKTDLPSSPIDDCMPHGCKYVDIYVSSRALLSTNDCVSPAFEKHTTCKMGYTRGGIWKNGQGIAISIAPKLHTAYIRRRSSL